MSSWIDTTEPVTDEEPLAEDHGGPPEETDETLGPEIESILNNAPVAEDIEY